MTALAAMTARQTRNDSLASYASYVVDAAQTVYEGSLVVVNASNLARAGVDTAGYFHVGIATNTATAGQTVNVKFGHEELFETSVTLLALTGAIAVIKDSDVVTSVADGANDIKVGEITQFVSTTRAWIKIRSAATI